MRMVNNRFLEYTHFVRLAFVTNTIDFYFASHYTDLVSLLPHMHTFYQCQNFYLLTFLIFYLKKKTYY